MAEILQQDDAAPDSLESFERDFTKVTGLTVAEFKLEATRTDGDDDDYLEWAYGNYCLRISADDPYYSLYTVTTQDS